MSDWTIETHPQATGIPHHSERVRQMELERQHHSQAQQREQLQRIREEHERVKVIEAEERERLRQRSEAALRMDLNPNAQDFVLSRQYYKARSRGDATAALMANF